MIPEQITLMNHFSDFRLLNKIILSRFFLVKKSSQANDSYENFLKDSL